MNDWQNKYLTDNAKRLRKNMTKEEKHLWYDFLKNLNVTVQRQKVLKCYIVDFYIHKAKLIIELDGSQHYTESGERDDAVRDDYFRRNGYTVLRYTNLEIQKNFGGVCEDIMSHLTPHPSPDTRCPVTPSPQGEGWVNPMKKILFVCTGNTCRSPMAAVIFNQLAAQSGLEYVAESAGVAAVGDRPASENAIKAVAEIGLDLSMHRTRFLPSLDLNEYSLFVALNDEHYEILRSIGIPENMLRLLRRAPNVDDIYDLRQGIVDPFGGDLNAYRKCRDEIIGAVKLLITTL